MSTRIKVLQACNILESAVMVSQLNQTNRQEVSQALALLREIALKAVPEASAQTATQIDERARKTEIIAHGDSLEAFAALMPYLLRRRECARMFTDRPSDGALQYIEAINKTIAELLNIF